MAGACLKWRKSSGRRGKDEEGISVKVKCGVDGEGDGLKIGAGGEGGHVFGGMSKMFACMIASNAS